MGWGGGGGGGVFFFEAEDGIRDRLVTGVQTCALPILEDEGIFEEEKGESETLAGFILEVSGKFPKKGAKINFANYTFTVEALDRKRIKQVKVTRKNA